MSALQLLIPPTVVGVTLSVTAATVHLAGTITSQDPSKSVGVFLKSAHQACVKDGLKDLLIDVTGLTFVNSSSIRMFIDWATWVRALPEAQRYRLTFKTHRSVTWQRTSFSALKSLAPDVVSVQTS